MKNHKILLKILQQSPNQGISLTELLVALVISGIVLTATASGFMNILRANRDVESKSNQLSNLTRALTFIQEDIKQGFSVTSESGGECDVDSECLVINLTDGSQIYYGFEDISQGDQIWLKPGILQRKDASNTWEVVADGLAINAEDPDCEQGSINWGGGAEPELYGDTENGFRFCIDESDESDPPNYRLARIFLYGHIIGSDTPPMNVDIVTFARSQPEDSNDDD